jgi:hypothetical protein
LTQAKWVAYGIVPYLKDRWDLLDCVVVLTAWLSQIPSFSNYSAIRALRVFRAFKSVSAVPGPCRRLAFCVHFRLVSDLVRVRWRR